MKKHLVRLAEAERTELRAFTRSETDAQAITRARLLLMADQQGESRNDVDIAKALGITVHTVEVTRKRYVQHGLRPCDGRHAKIKASRRKWTGGSKPS